MRVILLFLNGISVLKTQSQPHEAASDLAYRRYSEFSLTVGPMLASKLRNG